ncbi:NADH dehydrogenase subunit 5 (mitochondrion) [Amblyomma americanum]|uniref:NADH-ubiquinone oxidoreductase chain 5 n=2 Tax=Amblyomma americanum TaxID=6943 RepID=A0A0K0PRG2_AMBAM|nr:NADH dehydrogenase subunit 5 [Amblyomma americanum]AKQ50900.1 NADH dehydrogenase subunit 5 [Amblyomma americanum]
MFMNWSLMLMMMSLMFGELFLESFFKNNIIVLEYILISIQNLDFKFYFLMDWVSMLFSMVVLMISSLVIMYSKSYMHNDKNKNSFCVIVLLFVASMIFLILMPNMFSIILGWDGLGLVSYCLVIYYQSVNSYNSGMMTVISNRVGDVMIMMSMIFFVSFGSFDFLSFNKIELICGILILVAGLTKSAQIPFSAWLPAAMAAPTPVSSLVHSSTLVTAGVYILIRFNCLFKLNTFSEILMKIALLTMLMAGVNAFFETDFKKIIAFSTLSQLSMMMVILSLGMADMAFFHLIMHAIFKSMLFLCAGFIIHSLNGIQDIRMLGNFFLFSPVISSCMMISILSLIGFPFIGGFYSKDLIVEFFFFKVDNFLLTFVLILGIMFTFFYCFRLGYILLLKGSMNLMIFKGSFDFFMMIPIIILCFIMLISGNFIFWMTNPNLGLIFISTFWKIITILLLFMTILLFQFLKGLQINIDFFYKIWYLSNLTSYLFLIESKMFLKISMSDWTWMENLGPKALKEDLTKLFNFNFWVENQNLSKILLMIMVTIMVIM